MALLRSIEMQALFHGLVRDREMKSKLMRARWGSGVLDGLLEEPYGSGAEKGQQRGPAEDVDIGQERGLLLHQADRAGRRSRGGRWARPS